jgi:hypothetical protein
MKLRFTAVIFVFASFMLVGNAWGQPRSGQNQKSSVDTFLQWSSEQVNQLRNSCGRWMADLERRWSDSSAQPSNSAVPLADRQNMVQDGSGQGRQPALGPGMGGGSAFRTNRGQGQGTGSGRGQGAGTAFGTGDGQGSGTGSTCVFGTASGRGRRGNATTSGRSSRGRGKGRGRK